MGITEVKSRLKVLLGTNTAEVELRDGRKVKLYPLRLIDLADLEDKIGMPLTEIFSNSGILKVKHLLVLLWLSVRKDGLNKEEIDAQKWKITERDVGEWFNFNDYALLVEVTEAIFKISGLEIEIKNVESQPIQKASE